MGYMLLFMPTLALANSVAMRHMQSPEKQFPLVRVAGSIGWIVAGVLIGWLGWEQAHRLERLQRDSPSMQSIALS